MSQEAATCESCGECEVCFRCLGESKPAGEVVIVGAPELVGFLISRADGRRLAAAIDDCRPSDVIAIIKRQPWFKAAK